MTRGTVTRFVVGLQLNDVFPAAALEGLIRAWTAKPGLQSGGLPRPVY